MCTGNRKGTLWQCSMNSLISHLKPTEFCQILKALQAQGKVRKSKSFCIQGVSEYVKRVSFRLSAHIKASVTVEASIAIPVVLLCFLEVLSLLQCLSVYSGVLLAVKNVSMPISVYGYVYDEITEKNEEIHLGKEVISSLLFSEVFLDTQVKKQCSGPIFEQNIYGGAEGISLLGSYINERESCISIVANYYVEPLLSLTGRKQRMSNQLYTRMWTGYTVTQTAQEDYVYITESGSVYHMFPDCTHLKLSIQSVAGSELGKMRNDYGESYEACEKCCDGALQSIYYITKKGDRYHEELSCSGLRRTVSCVAKDSVQDRSLCERCSQRGE